MPPSPLGVGSGSDPRTRRRAAIGLWLVLVALCALQLSQTRFVADLSSFLPSAPTPEQRVLVDQLRDGALSRVMLIAIEGEHDVTRARLSQTLAAALRADARFASVANGAATGFEKERALLLNHRYAVSPRVTPERFSVDGLRENPGVAVLVESIRGTLAGDLQALTRTYSVGLDGTPERWRLVLRPLQPELATLAERIEIGGSQGRVATVEIFQADGDRSVMSLAPAAR